MLAALLPMLLAAASGAQDAPRADANAYRALGTEPFWAVTITDKAILYEDPEGPATEVERPRPRMTRGTLYYRTPELTVAIRNMECNDGMSDRRYADRVRVRIGERMLNGCGRAYPDSRSLDGTRWRIATVNDVAVATPRPATIAFAEDRVTGFAGCNRFSGGYTIDGGRLNAPRLATTKMACVGPGGETERALLDLLSGPVVAYPMRDGSIRLVGIGERSARLVRQTSASSERGGNASR